MGRRVLASVTKVRAAGGLLQNNCPHRKRKQRLREEKAESKEAARSATASRRVC